MNRYLAIKGARIVYLCGKSSRFADFENTVDCGSALIFDADFGLCPSYVRTLGPKRNLDHRSSSALIGMLMSSAIIFFEKSSFKLGCETVIGLNCTVLLSSLKHVAFFTNWAKLTVPFTCTSLPLNLYTSVFGCSCGFGFEQKFW